MFAYFLIYPLDLISCSFDVHSYLYLEVFCLANLFPVTIHTQYSKYSIGTLIAFVFVYKRDDKYVVGQYL